MDGVGPAPGWGACIRYTTRSERISHPPLLKSPRVPARQRVDHDRLRRSLRRGPQQNPAFGAGVSTCRGEPAACNGPQRASYAATSARQGMEPRSSRCSRPLLAWPGREIARHRCNRPPADNGKTTGQTQRPGRSISPSTPSIKGSCKVQVEWTRAAMPLSTRTKRGGSGGYLASKGVSGLDVWVFNGPFDRDSRKLWSSLHMGV